MIGDASLLADLSAWPACAVQLSAEGKIEVSNGQLESLVGREVTGRSLSDLLDDGPTVEKWRALLESGESAATIELVFCADGMPIAPRAFSILRSAGGLHLVEHPAHPRLAQMAAEIEDTNTDLSTAQRALVMERSRLAAALKELERSNQALDEFAHAVSHDLKAPLRAIKDAGELLATTTITDAERGEYSARIATLVDRMRRMIDGVFTYARAGRRADSEEEIDTGRAMAELVEYLGPPKEVAVELDSSLPMICAERVPFDQVFRNLLSNAFTYRRGAGARVAVRAVVESDWVTFFVADNGPGIPTSQLPRIWRLFHTSTPGTGTGIGLAVVRRIVEAQGGSIDVDSTEGEGSTFRVRWPVKRMQLRGNDRGQG